MDDVAQLEYSLGIEKKNCIPVPLPNIKLEQKWNISKGEQEGQRESFPLWTSGLGTQEKE